MLDKKLASDLTKILQIINDRITSHAALKKVTIDKKILLTHIKIQIFKAFGYLCDHDIGIANHENCGSDNP